MCDDQCTIIGYRYPDIDECIANGVLGPCQQNCTNTIGSYFCNCSSGCIFGTNESVCIGKISQCRVLDTIKHTVYDTDIDECSNTDGLGPCQQNSTNTIGSYFCMQHISIIQRMDMCLPLIEEIVMVH